MHPPPPPRKKGMVCSKRLLEKNNPNNGLWVDLLLYLLDHSLIERCLYGVLQLWLTQLLSFHVIVDMPSPPPKKKPKKTKQN